MITMLRAMACVIWIAAGVISGTIAGYMSSVASAIFLICLIVEHYEGDL